MGFLDRIHGVVTGTLGALQAPVGLVKDLATASWDDEINGNALGVIWRRTTHRLGQMGENLLGPEEGLGAVIGGTPEFIRDPVRTITKPILDGAEWLYREGVAEPISAAVTASSLMDAGHGFDLGQGYKIAQKRSPGQAIALAFTTKDILDETEVEKAMGGDAYEIISGVADATFRFTLDPTIIGGKALKLTKGAVLGRATEVKAFGGTFRSGHHLTTANGLKRALESRGVGNFERKIYELHDELAGTAETYVTPGITKEAAVPKLAKGEKASGVYKAPGPEGKPGWSVRVDSGDVDAAPKFHFFEDEKQARLFAKGGVEAEVEKIKGKLEKLDKRNTKTERGRANAQAERGRLEKELADLAPEREVVQEGIKGGTVEALANRLRDQFFPDHSHGGLISYVLAEAAQTGDVKFALRAIMGDGDALAQVTTRNAELAAQIGRIEEGAAEVSTWGSGYATKTVGKKALQDAERESLVKDLDLGQRLESAYGKAQEAPRVSKSGELRQALKEQEWIYQKGPLAAVVHTVFDMQPQRLIRLSDTGGDVQLARALKNSPFDEAESAVWRAHYARAVSPAERAQVMESMEREGIRRITDGLHPDDVTAFEKVAAESMAEVKKTLEGSNRIYDGKGRSKIEYEGLHGKTVSHHLPLWATQNEPVHLMVNWEEMAKVRAEIEGHVARFGRLKEFPADKMEQFYHYWKPAVLLRAGWPIRVVGDEQLRILAKIGAVAHLEEIRGAVKESLSNKWNRVPKTEKSTYFFGDVRTRRGYEMERAGGGVGQMENLMPDYLDARANFQGQIGSHEKTAIEELRTGQWTSTKPDDPLYARDWEQAANGQIGTDVMGRMFLEGKTEEQVVEWLRSTSDGRRYAKQYPHRSDLKQWARSAKQQADAYVPIDTAAAKAAGASSKRIVAINKRIEKIDEILQRSKNQTLRDKVASERMKLGDELDDLATEAASRGPTLREKVLAGTAKHEDLVAATGGQNMPIVHGEALKQATKGSVADDFVGKSFAFLFDKLGRMPTNRLSRSKYFDHVYRLEAERLTNLADEFAESQGRMLGANELRAIEDGSREYALSEMNKLLYNLAEQSEMASVLRHVSPFYMAWQEVITRWSGLAIENPAFAARMRQVWMAPEKAGLVVDEEGKEVQWDGNPDEVGKERYLVVAVPEFVKDMPYFKKMPDMKFNKKSFNTILQGVPGLGPPVQVALNDVIKDRPKLEDALKKVMPMGPQSVMDQILPTTLKRFNTASEGDENRDYLSSKMRIFHDLQVDYNLGKREEKPTWEEANRRAQDFWSMRTVASFMLPAQPSFMSPYQMYIDAYRQRMKIDPKGADDWFLTTYGEEYFPLTVSMSKSMDGVNPTREGFAARQKYEDLIEMHPELGGLIIGEEGAGEFSSTVFRAQMEQKIGGEGELGQETQRRMLTEQESESRGNVKLGWREYGQFMDLIDAERKQRGLPNLQVKGANDLALIKKRLTEKLAEKNPEWFGEFSVRDSQHWNKRIAGMRDIVNFEEHPEIADRDEFKGLKEYLHARDLLAAELKKRANEGGAKTLTAKGNYDLQLAWESIKSRLVDKNLAFAQLYNRWLEHDPVEVA